MDPRHRSTRPPRRTELHVPAVTFIKLVVAVGLTFVLIRLLPLLTLFALATLLAVTLHPAVEWLGRRGLARWLSIALVAGVFVAGIALLALAIIPALVEQLSGIGRNLDQLQGEIMARIPSGRLRDFTSEVIRNPTGTFGKLPEYLTVVGAGVLGGVSSLGYLLILALYLLIDGHKAWNWAVTFFPRQTQLRLRITAREISPILFAYVSGQLITSGLVAVFVFVVMTALHVPGALLLAAIAAVFDILPVIGFIASTLTAVLLALTVSTSTAILVVILYTAYQALENYLIVPKVYGNRMRISTLVVLLSFSAAAPLGGIPAVLLALPVAASYPVIERIWLRRQLGDEVVDSHQSQLRTG